MKFLIVFSLIFSIIEIQCKENIECKVFECSNCWDWYNEFIQYQVWLPKCGDHGPGYESEFRLKSHDKRMIYNKCLKAKLKPKTSDCEQHAKTSKGLCSVPFLG